VVNICATAKPVEFQGSIIAMLCLLLVGDLLVNKEPGKPGSYTKMQFFIRTFF
jgi:hypothetical protein